MKLWVQVTPGAKKRQVVGFEGGILRIKVKSPPKEGKANKELEEFLSELLDVPKSSVKVVKGHTSRKKLIEIKGVEEEQLKAVLSKH